MKKMKDFIKQITKTKKGKKITAVVLSASIVLGVIAPAAVLFAKADSYLPWPEVGENGYLVANLEDTKYVNSSTYSYFNRAEHYKWAYSNRGFYEFHSGSGGLRGAEIRGYYYASYPIGLSDEQKKYSVTYMHNEKTLPIQSDILEQKYFATFFDGKKYTEYESPFYKSKNVAFSGDDATIWSYIRVAFVDRYKPGSQGWTYSVTDKDPQFDNRPILWLDAGEMLRPADYKITPDDLKNVRIKLTLDNSNLREVYDKVDVIAEAVALNNEDGKIGFKIVEDDWQKISRKEYETADGITYGARYIVVSVTDASIGETYYIERYMDYTPNMFKYAVNTPVVDLAGNPIQLPDNKNVAANNLYIDALDPFVTRIEMSGSSLADVEPDENGTIEIEDATQLISNVGDKVDADLIISKKLLESTISNDMKLEWSVNDKYGNPVTTSLLGYSNYHRESVNSDYVTKLNFAPFTITSDMTVSGTQIKPVRLINAGNVTDSSDNHLAEGGSVDFVKDGTPVNKQTFLDIEGPSVEVVDTVKEIDSETGEVHIIAELNISDGVNADGKFFAGIERKGEEPNGYITIKGYNGETELPFKFAFTDSITLADDTYLNENYVGDGKSAPLLLTSEGTYFMHVLINEVEGAEISNKEGIEIDFRLKDAVENERETTILFDNLDIDQVGPTVTISQAFGVITPNYDETSTQTVSACITAKDTNGILSIDYKWGEDGMWENAYTFYGHGDAEQIVETTVVGDITGSGTVVETLYVRVNDVKSDKITANLQTEETSVYTLDLNRVNANYEIIGDPSLPDGSINIKVFEPEYAGTAQGKLYTRAFVTVADVENYMTVIKTYVRVFDSYTEDGTNLFGEGTWYRVNLSNNGELGIYGDEIVVESPDWTRYGEMTVQFAASMTDLTPVAGARYDSSEDPMLHESEKFTVRYAPKNDNVHRISNVTVRNNLNEVQTITEKTYNGSKVSYYKFNNSIDGVRYHYNLNNALMYNWYRYDINFDNSYAVLIKLDTEGNPLTDENGAVVEVSERVKLSEAEEQRFAIKGTDYESGLYALQVYVEQKAGGKQTFTLDAIMFDAAIAPSDFGVSEHTVTASIDAYDGGVQVVNTAPEGQYLSFVSLGAATREEHQEMVDDGNGNLVQTYFDNRELVKIGDNPIYLAGDTNSLNGNGDTSIRFTTTLGDDSYYEAYLGEKVGSPLGLRIWNAASTGDYNSVNISAGFRELTEGEFYADVLVNLLPENILTAEELAATNVADGLKLTAGENVVCYQVVMTNGAVSSVRQMKVNVDTEAPDAEFGINFSEFTIEKSVDADGNDIRKYYAEFADAYVESVSYDDAGLKLYIGYGNGSGYSFEEITDYNSIPLINSNGYLGKFDKSSYSDLNQILCVVDSSGNARIFYPILTNEHDSQNGDYKNNANNEYPYGIAYWFLETGNYGTEDGITYKIRNVTYSDYAYEGSNGWAYGYSLAETVEYFTVQINNEAPVTIWADPDDSRNNFDSAETGGVVGYERITEEYTGTYDDINLVMPYDSEVPEGEDVEHTVKLVYYGWENEDGGRCTYEYETTITAPNTKPVITQDTTVAPTFGQVPLTANTYVKLNEYAGTDYSLNPTLTAYSNGEYEVEFTDKFGRTYTQTVDITGFGDNPSIEISETAPTCKPVTVTVKCTDGTASVDEATLPEGTAVTGNSTAEMTIVLQENATFNITYGDTQYPVNITNINTTPISPKAIWIYDTAFAEENGYVEQNVTVILTDENGSRLIDSNTGSSVQYIFVAGGETTHTFTGYVNEYGMEGADFTVELPVEIRMPELSTTKDDTYKPDVAIGTFVTYNNNTHTSPNHFESVDETRPEDSMVILNQLTENPVSDMDEYIKSLGWAEKYNFKIEVADENETKLFITTDIYGDVPKFSTGTSEVIDGVTLMGRSLIVTKNVTFVLHIVDSENNVNSIMFDIQSLGEGAPAPEYAQVLTKSGDAVRLYLLPPSLEGVTDLAITNTEPVAVYEDDKDSVFYGCPYLSYSFEKDTDVVVYYSYKYNSITYTGEIKTTIKAIDATVPYVESEKWSANYDPNGEKLTNSDISVQLDFDKDLSSVVLVNAAGEEITAPEGVKVSNLQDRVTVVFKQNTTSKLYLKVTATVNKKQTVIELPVISTIDKTPPVVTASVEYSENHRSAVVTFTADELITLTGVAGSGTSISRTVTEPGEKTYNIFDAAGNVVRLNVDFSEIITEDLVLTIGIKGSDGKITVIDKPEEYDIKVGDTFYAKVSRDSTISVSRGAEVNAPAGEWVMLTVEADSAGLYPTVYAVDAYGNSAFAQFAKIPLADYLAPSLIIDKGIVSISIDASDEEVTELLRGNIAASDNRTSTNNLVFDFEYVRSVGKNSVIYKVTDEAGNTTSRVGWIRFYDGNEARITVNGEIVERDSTIIVEKGTQEITVNFSGEPYKLVWEQGRKTAGNLKVGATYLTDGYSKDTNKTYQVSLDESGYYTFLLTTQGRDTIRFVLYVE